MKQVKEEVKIQACKVYAIGGILLNDPIDCPLLAQNSVAFYCQLRKKDGPTLFIETIFEKCPFKKGDKNVN